MNSLKLLAAAAVVSALAACASIVAETPQQRVFALKSDYRALVAVALAYESQPRCDEVAEETLSCSDEDAVKVIRQADANADAALDAAESVVRSEAAASGDTIELVLESATEAVNLFREALVINGVI